MNFEIFLSPPHMTGNEGEFIQQAFDSNWIAPLGPHVDAFEKEVANYIDSDLHALALSSGTAAIHLALRLLGVKAGDAVLCPSFTFIGSANPILYQGARPVFVDSEDSSWNISPSALEIAIKALKRDCIQPKAVIIVNLYGQSADMAALNEICKPHGIPIIEDAAESLGAEYQGRKSGSFGDFSILSFNGNKIITTSGGGMLLSRNSDHIKQARFLATQARDPAIHYQHSEMGYNYRLSNLLAAVGRAQLQVLPERVERRRKINQIYRRELANIPAIEFLPEATYGKSTHWLSVMRVDSRVSKITPTQIVQYLQSESIEARPVWKPLHLQPLFKNCLFYSHLEKGSVVENFFETGVCLPSGSSLSELQQNKVISKIKNLFS